VESIRRVFGLTINRRVLALLLCMAFGLGVAAATAEGQMAYPLKVSPNHRYLVDQNDRPFMIVGDSPQGLITDLSISEAAAYFANRASYGFNAVQIHLLGKSTFGGRGDYSTYDGLTPFSTPGDISTPQAAYFARVDAMLDLAAQNGIVVFLNAAETIDSLGLFRDSGVAKSRAFGQYLGSRYRNFDNIVWMYGNDFQSWQDPNDNAVILAVANGIKDTDFRHLHTAWLNYFVSASRDSADWDAVSDIDFVYTYYSPYDKTLGEYALTPPKPVFLGESNYEGESISVPLTTPEIVRRQEYWTMTSGATGSFYGNFWTWPFRPGWQDHYNSPGAAQMPYFRDLFATRSWWNLSPDASHQVLTAGYGTYDAFGGIASNDYVTAAMAADSSLMIAYLPSIRTVSVNLSKFAAPVTARWYDPSNGTYATISGSPFSNAGTQNFTPAGSNSDGNGDWVLVMEAIATDATPPAISGVAVSNLTTSSAVVNWITNEPSDGQVEYGLTTAYGLTTTLAPNLVTAHAVSLVGLAANTTYHYRVRSKDAAGNLAISPDGTFSMPPPAGLSAQFLGAGTEDFVGPSQQLRPNGIPDWRIRLQGLSSVPNKVRITSSSSGGLWQGPRFQNTWLIATQYGVDGTGTLWFEPLAGSTTFHVQVWYADGTTAETDATTAPPPPPPPPPPATLTAAFLGVTGQDRVGQSGALAPNEIPDWQIHVQGLRSTPTRVRITSAAGGVWEAPFNGANWLVATQYGTDGTGDFWFEPWGTPGFHVKVFYSDGTTDEADANSSPPPPPPPPALTATFLGVTGQDRVGQNGLLAPNGILDWQIHVQGLRSTPTRVLIASVGGLWEAPFNGTNWLVGTQYGVSGDGDFWFEPWGSPVFHVKVFYSDGTTDEVDATNPLVPSTLTAAFLGVTAQDRVGQNGLLAANGIADWQIHVQGLRATPTRVRITSAAGGVWEVPFSGAWLVATQYDGGGAGDFWFEPWGTPGFHVKVLYADGTTDEADTAN
jgi:Protein of unknown function (DUF4038)/Putative collagen-binding domain of a collagenase/Purple acid Phosphatase, N-terminal domain